METKQILLPVLLIAYSVCLSQSQQNIRDILPLWTSLVNRNVNNLPNNEECPCFPVPSIGNNVLQNLGLKSKTAQRTVFYAYKDSETNKISIYVPNLRKQRLFPELPYDKDDVQAEFNIYDVLYKHVNGLAKYISVDGESGGHSVNNLPWNQRYQSMLSPGKKRFNIHLNLPHFVNGREEELLPIGPGTLPSISEKLEEDPTYYKEPGYPADHQINYEIEPTDDSISVASDNYNSVHYSYQTEPPLDINYTESPLTALSELSPDQKIEYPNYTEPADLEGTNPNEVSNQLPNVGHQVLPENSQNVHLQPEVNILNEDSTAIRPEKNNDVAPKQQIYVQPGFFDQNPVGQPDYQAYQHQQLFPNKSEQQSNSQQIPVYSGQDVNEPENNGPLDTTFDAWFADQLRNVVFHGPVVDEIDFKSLKALLQKTLLKQGIYVNQEGLLIDSHGSVLDLANLHLRPMLIGSTVPYQKLVKGEPLKSGNDDPYLEVLLISLANPPKILGLIPLGITYVPTAAHKLSKQVRTSNRKSASSLKNSILTKYLSSRGIIHQIPQSSINQQQQEMLRPPSIYRSLDFSVPKKPDYTQWTRSSGIESSTRLPLIYRSLEFSVPKKPDYTQWTRSSGIESSTRSGWLAGINPLQYIYSYILGNKNFTEFSEVVTEPPKGIRYRIIGGNSALNSGPVFNVKGRHGYYGKR